MCVYILSKKSKNMQNKFKTAENLAIFHKIWYSILIKIKIKMIKFRGEYAENHKLSRCKKSRRSI